MLLSEGSGLPDNTTNNNSRFWGIYSKMIYTTETWAFLFITYCHRIVQILRKDNIAKRSLHYVLPYGIGANVVRIFYIWKEKGEYLQIKMKKLKKSPTNATDWSSFERAGKQKSIIGSAEERRDRTKD